MIIPIYTTTKSSWYQKKADIVADRISQTRGRGQIKFQVRHFKPFLTPRRFYDSDGDRVLSWEYLQSYFGNGPWVFHFTPYYRKKWGVTSGQEGKVINGSRNTKNRLEPQFWVCSDKSDANGYTISEFERLLYHEYAHFDEDIDDEGTNLLTQKSVHFWDYEQKKIHLYHLMVDYRGLRIKQQLIQLTSAVIKYAQYVITNTISTPRNK